MVLQSIDSPDASTMLVKTLMFYIVMNLEAFTFCFAGEYLSSKVRRVITRQISLNRFSDVTQDLFRSLRTSQNTISWPFQLCSVFRNFCNFETTWRLLLCAQSNNKQLSLEFFFRVLHDIQIALLWWITNFFTLFASQSQNIADAAYESLWYDMHVNESQVVTFLILRSQKRLTITIEKIADLSLERFASVSAHFIALPRTHNDLYCQWLVVLLRRCRDSLCKRTITLKLCFLLHFHACKYTSISSPWLL